MEGNSTIKGDPRNLAVFSFALDKSPYAKKPQRSQTTCKKAEMTP